MHVRRVAKDSGAVYSCITFEGMRATYAQFTPLQPMLDALRLLDCVPARTHIPGVGCRYYQGGDLTSYELED